MKGKKCQSLFLTSKKTKNPYLTIVCVPVIGSKVTSHILKKIQSYKELSQKSLNIFVRNENKIIKSNLKLIKTNKQTNKQQ